jgi:CDP-glucose 4,6-dehydratase
VTRVPDPEFWRNRKVLVTGHSGFKGAWLVHWLSRFDAAVTGLALPPEGTPNLFTEANVEELCDSHFCDLADKDGLRRILRASQPDIVLHLAAQALVRRSLAEPSTTFETNVQGTINLLEAIRAESAPQVTLVVTSDKVYRNDGLGRDFLESDPLGGRDPYSASKAACEIAVHSYRSCFFSPGGSVLASVRAGNVIGGGDFSADRIVPDCIRAMLAGDPVELRHPEATRPWQHVLDCLCGYLLYVEELSGNPECPSAMNIGPDTESTVTVGELTTALYEAFGLKPNWIHRPVPGSLEAKSLSLDPALAKKTLSWSSALAEREAVSMTAQWYSAWRSGAAARQVTLAQIHDYEKSLSN